MNNRLTSRSTTAFFLAALVVQVFVLKGLHHCMGQCNEKDETLAVCSFEGIILDVEGGDAFSCNICLFHLAPTDCYVDKFTVRLAEAVSSESQFIYLHHQLTNKFRQAYLRGPPTFNT